MKKVKIVVISLIGITLLSVAGFLVWSSITYKPTAQLIGEVTKFDLEENTNEDLIWEGSNGTGIILYAGAKVEHAAYAYYAEQLAQEGYTVILPSIRLNFALLDANAAEEYIDLYPEIDTWIVGGHSLGGVAAAMFANDHDDVDGLILLGSYPSESSDLSKDSIDVLSLYAQFDGLTSLEKIEKSMALLPPDTTFVEIQGGNHAQFGMYGEQKGDQKATISTKQQQDIMVEDTIKWLEAMHKK